MAESVDQDEINLFALNPAISYVGPDMIKGDPTFWKPAPAAEPKKERPRSSQQLVCTIRNKMPHPRCLNGGWGI